MVLRKFALALLGVGMMLPGLSHALAVSDLKTISALGQPFVGEIDLLDVGDLNADEIKVSLATQEDFDRLGVERVYFLNDLHFDVVVNPSGRSYVRITCDKPVREPYLDFVVRVAWPGNASLRELTALLDPPSDATTPDVTPADVTPAVSSAPLSASSGSGDANTGASTEQSPSASTGDNAASGATDNAPASTTTQSSSAEPSTAS